MILVAYDGRDGRKCVLLDDDQVLDVRAYVKRPGFRTWFVEEDDTAEVLSLLDFAERSK